jgi:hypothetical protein
LFFNPLSSCHGIGDCFNFRKIKIKTRGLEQKKSGELHLRDKTTLKKNHLAPQTAGGSSGYMNCETVELGRRLTCTHVCEQEINKEKKDRESTRARERERVTSMPQPSLPARPQLEAST